MIPEILLHWREHHPCGWYQTQYAPGLAPGRVAVFRLVLGDACDTLTGAPDTNDKDHTLTRYIAGTAAELCAGLLINFVEATLAEWEKGVRDVNSVAGNSNTNSPRV